MDRRAWQTSIYGVTKSWTRLSDYHFLFKVFYPGNTDVEISLDT